MHIHLPLPPYLLCLLRRCRQQRGGGALRRPPPIASPAEEAGCTRLPTSALPWLHCSSGDSQPGANTAPRPVLTVILPTPGVLILSKDTRKKGDAAKFPHAQRAFLHFLGLGISRRGLTFCFLLCSPFPVPLPSAACCFMFFTAGCFAGCATVLVR